MAAAAEHPLQKSRGRSMDRIVEDSQLSVSDHVEVDAVPQRGDVIAEKIDVLDRAAAGALGIASERLRDERVDLRQRRAPIPRFELDSVVRRRIVTRRHDDAAEEPAMPDREGNRLRRSRSVRKENVDSGAAERERDLPRELEREKPPVVSHDQTIPSGTGNGVFRWVWHVLGPEKAKDYYTKIRAQAAAVDRDQRRQIEWIAQGKYPVHLAPGTVMYQLEKRGLKFGVIPSFKDYGAYLTPGFGSVMVMNKSPHHNAAKIFLNWLLTKEGQTVFSKGMGYVSRRLDVSSDHVPSYWVPKDGVKYWPGYYEEDAKMSPEQVKFLKSIFGR